MRIVHGPCALRFRKVLYSGAMSTDSPPLRPEEVARRTLVLAALDKSGILTDRTFSPGATVTVGSNSKNDLVIPERFELATYRLLSEGSLLHLLPPLHVNARVWLGEEVVELKGFFRDLKRQHPALPETLAVAGDRFIVSYAGVSFLGRFVESFA